MPSFPHQTARLEAGRYGSQQLAATGAAPYDVTSTGGRMAFSLAAQPGIFYSVLTAVTGLVKAPEASRLAGAAVSDRRD